MENASKALIMVAGVLLGIMVISLAVYLFSEFGSSTKQMSDELAQTKISEFNVQFTKYVGTKTLRAHDIVNIANLAIENNRKYYGDDDPTLLNSKGEPYYIQVKLENAGIYSATNFELGEDKFKDFIKDYSLVINGHDATPVYFECTSVEINQDTKFVWKVTFKKL